ncbi:MAG: hypothetical protein WCU88_08985 [Elusimicrobiota bacterium]
MENAFIGHYGEMINLPVAWTAEAELQSRMEVVYFHEKYERMGQGTAYWEDRPYRPAREDYTLENLTAKRLMQLLVIPKDVPGFKSLEAMRRAKGKAYKKEGVKYFVWNGACAYCTDYHFPENSFTMDIGSREHGFIQFYTESDDHFFILSMGNIRESSPKELILKSLERYISTRRAGVDRDPRQMFSYRLLWFIFGGSNLICIIFALLSRKNKWLAPMVIAGRFMLVFSNLLAIIGVALLFFLDYFGIRGAIPIPSLLTAMAMPWLCRETSCRIGGIKPARVFLTCLFLSVPLSLFFLAATIGIMEDGEKVSSAYYAVVAMFQMLIALGYAVVFALTHVSSRGSLSQSMLGVCLIFLCIGSGHSQEFDVPEPVEVDGVKINVGPMQDSVQNVAWKYLRKARGTEATNIHDVGKESLRSKEEFYDYQRVEFRGIWSLVEANEGDSSPYPDEFDKKVSFSFMDEARQDGPIGTVIRKGRNFVKGSKDLFLASKSMGPELSERGADVLGREGLEYANIKELVAHSWGSEIAYTAILNGDIYPPQRLIIVGPPDANMEKWKALQKYTGIEVIVVGFEWDKARMANVDLRERFLRGERLSEDPAELDKMWDEKCKKLPSLCSDERVFDPDMFRYNLNVDPKTEFPRGKSGVRFVQHSIDLDHWKTDYYDYLRQLGILPLGSLKKAQAEQVERIEEEGNAIWDDAMAQAPALLAKAKAIHESNEAARRNRAQTSSDEQDSCSEEEASDSGTMTQEEAIAKAMDEFDARNRRLAHEDACSAMRKQAAQLAKTWCANPASMDIRDFKWNGLNCRDVAIAFPVSNRCEDVIFKELAGACPSGFKLRDLLQRYVPRIEVSPRIKVVPKPEPQEPQYTPPSYPPVYTGPRPKYGGGRFNNGKPD